MAAWCRWRRWRAPRSWQSAGIWVRRKCAARRLSPTILERGERIYISGSLEANYLYDRVVSTSRLLFTIVQHLGGGAPQPFRMAAPIGVYGVLRRAPNGDLALWVLANVGFKDASSGRMRQEYVPVIDLEVAIRIPEGREAVSMQLLRAGTPAASFRVLDGYALGRIPRVHIAEVVHLVLAG